jgi:hypothetical protein
MVKWGKVTLALILVLLCSTTLGSFWLQSVKAQFQGDITINADGSINPSSAPIIQNGNIYTLTSDVKGEILITKSDIIFNGNRHTVDQYETSQDQGNAVGVALDHVYNVTLANLTITNTGNGIYALQQPTAGVDVSYGGSNVIIENNVVNNYNALSFLESNNNIITQNNFTNNNNPYVTVGAVMFWGSSNNTIYHNNFIENRYPAGAEGFDSLSSGNTWDNGKEGNYWSDYQTKYPNATEIDATGIGDTPYVINQNNIDHYPLTKPAAPSIPELQIWIILPIFMIATLLTAVVYLKKRKH